MTVYVVADLDGPKGLSVVRNALEFAVRHYQHLISRRSLKSSDL